MYPMILINDNKTTTNETNDLNGKCKIESKLDEVEDLATTEQS